MKRMLFLLSFLVLFASSAFAENSKLDKDLNDRVKHSKSTDKVRVIVQLVTPATAADKAGFAKFGKSVRNFDLFKAYVLELPVSLVNELAKFPKIIHISVDAPVKAHVVGGEPNVVSGAALATQTYGVTGQGIGVAVLDSGIANHPDLHVAKAVDFIDPTRSGGYDPYGHGTHVAGIIAGSGASAGGQHQGSAQGVNLVDLRVLDQNGGGYTSDVIAAINWVIANRNMVVNGQSLNIRVVNLSMGHRPFESTEADPLAQACRTAVRNGIVVVVSAGNYGKDANGLPMMGGVTSPGNEPSVLTVGAMTDWGTDSRADDTVASYSSRGPTAIDHRIKPDIMAPGSHTVSTMSSGSYLATTYPQYLVDGSYMSLSGTSMAAPVISAAVALLLEKNPGLTPNAAKAALMFTTESRPEGALFVGAGYANVAGAVNLAANINTAAPAGQNWLINGGLGLNYNNLIGGTAAVWGQLMNWGSRQDSANAVFYNAQAWGTTIVWDETMVWDQVILSGQTI